MRRTLPLLLILAALCAAAPLEAQRRADTPRRPAVALADSNDARAYLQFAHQSLTSRPREAADAYWWAYQLDPTSSDALYGRHAALLMSVPTRLVDYWQGDRRVVRSREVQAIDSLYFRALTMNPFMYREHEHHVFRLYLRTWARSEIDRSEGGHSVTESFINEWINTVMHNGSAYMKAREAYSQRRFPDALRLLEEAYREARARDRSWLRAERARLLAHTGDNTAALTDFSQAIADMRRTDERDLVFLYESKALLEHATGMLYERMGNLDAAREAYGRALTEDLAFYPAHVRLGLLALAAGDTATAVGELDLASQAAGADAGVHYTYGAMLAQLGRLDEAAVQLARASELAPYYADPYFAMGVVRDGQGNVDAARQAYQGFMARAALTHRRRSLAQQRLADLGAAPQAQEER